MRPSAAENAVPCGVIVRIEPALDLSSLLAGATPAGLERRGAGAGLQQTPPSSTCACPSRVASALGGCRFGRDWPVPADGAHPYRGDTISPAEPCSPDELGQGNRVGATGNLAEIPGLGSKATHLDRRFAIRVLGKLGQNCAAKPDDECQAWLTITPRR